MSREDRSLPFHRVSVENAFNVVDSKATLIEWEMEPWFVDKGPWVFQVFRTQKDDLTDWIPVGDPVVNQGYAYDVDRTVFTLQAHTYYKVQVTTGSFDEDGNPCVYESVQTLATNNLTRRDWRLLKDMVRKEKLALTKFTGARGWLLPYPKFGDQDLNNVDPNTNENMGSQDPDTFGTGYIGGYWGPINAYVELSPEKRLTKLTESGKISTVIRTGTVLAFPRFSPRDVWVNGMTDERYTVGPNIVITASIRGIPIKANIELEKVEPSHVIYSIPVPMQV